MNDPSQNEHLLTDILGEGIPADVRDGLLHKTLRLVSRRRRFRQARRAASALAVLLGLGLLFWHQFRSSRGPAASPAKPYLLVCTQPLPQPAWVATRPLSPSKLVASASAASVVVTAKAGVPVRELNDDELLALAPGPVVLVWHAPHSADLVFVNAADRDELLRY